MPSYNYTYVDGDDWVGLYLGDQLVSEGHSIHVLEILEIVQRHGLVDSFKSVEPDMDWLYEVGNLPEKLEDVKLEGG